MQYIHLVSNGSTEEYPDNKLTTFTNKFPIPLDIDSRYEVGVKEFGMSTAFKNITLPSDEETPSIIVAKFSLNPSYTADKLCSEDELKNMLNKISSYFNIYDWADIDCLNDELKYSSISFKFKNDWKLLSKRDDKGLLECEYWEFHLRDKAYTKDDLDALNNKIKFTCGVEILFKHNRLSFQIADNFPANVDGDEEHKYCFIMLHPTFSNSFNFMPTKIKHDIPKMGNLVSIGGARKFMTSTLYGNEAFDTFLLSISVTSTGYIVNNDLKSSYIDLSKNLYPKYIKICSNQIRAQILDTTYSKDLLVFSPDFKHQEDYTMRELQSIDFIPLLNNRLTDFDIKLYDEKNNLLQLTTGTPTIIKLAIQKMPLSKNSFNVRLTSTPTNEYPTNTMSRFKVKLPTPLQMDETWKVSINTISHPTKFSTFLEDYETRFIKFKPLVGDEKELILKPNYVYEEWELCDVINSFLSRNRFGSCVYNDKAQIEIFREGVLEMANYVARVLGFYSMGDKRFIVQCKKYNSFHNEHTVNTTPDDDVQTPGDDVQATENLVQQNARSTFPATEQNSRSVIFQFVGTNTIVSFEFKGDHLYEEEELVREFNKYLQDNTIGDCLMLNNQLTTRISARGKMVIGRKLANALGFTLFKKDDNKPFVLDTKKELSEEHKLTIPYEGKMEMGILRPNYMLIYSNIVRSTIVGGGYAKLLRMAPVKRTNLDYTITEFEHKEFYLLENYEIGTIEIQLCSHDGQPMNFISMQDVIVNLEFSNYQ